MISSPANRSQASALSCGVESRSSASVEVARRGRRGWGRCAGAGRGSRTRRGALAPRAAAGRSPAAAQGARAPARVSGRAAGHRAPTTGDAGLAVGPQPRDRRRARVRRPGDLAGVGDRAALGRRAGARAPRGARVPAARRPGPVAPAPAQLGTARRRPPRPAAAGCRSPRGRPRSGGAPRGWPTRCRPRGGSRRASDLPCPGSSPVRPSRSSQRVQPAQDDTLPQRPRTDPNARYVQEAHRRGSHDRARGNLVRAVG